MRRRIVMLLSAVCLLSLALAANPATGLQPTDTQLPNLVPISRIPSFEAMQGDTLRFDTFIQNRGAWAMEILGTVDVERQRVDAAQCTQWADPPVVGAARVCAKHERIGELIWHQSHNHLHLDGLATYRLYNDNNGAPGSLVHDAPKVGFCLTDTYLIQRYRSPVHAHPFVDPLLDDRYDLHRSQLEQGYPECRFVYGLGAPWPSMRMGISPGWQDLYNAPVPGQQFDMSSTADGTYWLQTLVNASPVVTVHETDLTDNEHWVALCVYRNTSGVRAAREGAC